jgi:hypothetical protein
MNTDKIKLINDITNDKPIRLRESYILNNYPDTYKDIIEFTKNIEVPFIQKLWHWVNDLDTESLCKCGNKKSFNRNWKDGYKKYCSQKCAQSDRDTKEKRKKTNLEKWGVDNIAKLDSIKEKQAKTNLERYGFTSSFCNEEVKQKHKQSILDNWGVDHYFKTEDFKIKAKSYYLKKWGVDHQLKVEEIKERIKNTCLSRYGVETYLNTEHSRSSIKKSNKSSYEDEICNILDGLNIKYIRNSFSIISPYSIDIYIESHNLAIEFNGLYWHSEFFKDKKYHQDKTLKCREKGIHLIHIFEDDWLSRKQVLISIIKNKLNLIEEKVFARKCAIREVNNKDTSEFLNQNHVQGYVRFTNSIGLYYNNELVSLMAFGWRATNSKKEYELIRFCNKINFNVVGGASKLFKYFINTNTDINSITSYSDISIFDGSIYKKLNFEFITKSSINYWWVVKGVRKHRFNYNKSKLVKMGYDKTKTEVEIMHELNNYRIWGCGQEKWIWYRK